MKIVALGTGHGSVTKCYNTCFALEKNDEYFLVDTGGGNGILNNLKAANIEMKKIKNIILSHSTDNDLEHRKQIFIEDAKKYYKGNVFAPYDLEIFEIV